MAGSIIGRQGRRADHRSIRVSDSAEWVRATCVNSGLVYPKRRYRVNLAPADLCKEGPAYDLPIAAGTLLASEQVSADLSKAGRIGELSLDGRIRSVTGVLPMAVAAREEGLKTFFLPEANAAEAGLVEGLEIIPVASLASLVGHFHGYAPIPIPCRHNEDCWIGLPGPDYCHKFWYDHVRTRSIEQRARPSSREPSASSPGSRD